MLISGGMAGDAEPAVSLLGQWDISASPRRKGRANAASPDLPSLSNPTTPRIRAFDTSYEKRVQVSFHLGMPSYLPVLVLHVAKGQLVQHTAS